jgi:hypothetical protein
MIITSFQFLGFVLATLMVFRLFPAKKQWWVLLAASIIFYLSFSIGGIFVMIGTSLLTYFSGIMVQKQKDKHYAWLKENSWKYGYIERYPESKQDITGITFSPWNFRYVGKDAAERIYQSGKTMEEYYGLS